MTDDKDLVSAIQASRKVSDDGSVVTYDLTGGIDFSNPKKLAMALADTFFRKDAMQWFHVSEDSIDFKPTCKVRIVLDKENHELLEKTADDFLVDIKSRELARDFSSQINGSAEKSTKFGSALASGVLNSLYKHSEKKMYKGYIDDDLYLDLLECLQIVSLNNEDLINWKNLHI